MQHKKQETIDLLLEAIDTLNDRLGHAPTHMDLIRETGLTSGTIARYLPYMREEGLIAYEPRHILRVIHDDDNKAEVEWDYYPELGSIACGQPLEAEENIIRWIPVPRELVGTGNYFFLRTQGFSMIDAGIEPDDLIFVRQQDTASLGDIVVALNEDGETTLKRLMWDEEKHCQYLQAENDAYDDLYGEYRIQGIVVKIIKDPK